MSGGPHPADQLDNGQVFEGKYRILRELGRGGFGMVYLAYQENMDRYVALKVLRPGASAAANSAKERFLREVRIIAKLKHPNTVTIHDFGTSGDGHLYMTLEYVEGETVKQIQNREGPQDPLRVADVARQIARSLSEAHKHGVVHRDLKPANIMITNIDGEKDFVKVLDFGVARLLDPKTNDLTSVGLPEGERELIGTPRYMSPEQVRGEALTGASDIYSLGLILYEMMCGEPAVSGDTTMALITQQISPEPLRLPHLHSFDPMLQDVIRIATSKPVQDRFQTADQVAEALEGVVFNLMRQRNLSGSQSNDIMRSYQSQLTNMDKFRGGRNLPSGQFGAVPNQWGPQTPSGQFVDSGYYNNPDPHASQFNPQPQFTTGQRPPQAVPGSGHHPQAPGGPGYPPYQGAPGLPQAVNSGRLPYPNAVGAHHSGQGIAVPQGNPNDAFNIDRNAEFEDFQQIMERDSLDPAKLSELSNAYSSGEMPSFSDLPPPPADERPFEDPRLDEPVSTPVVEVPSARSRPNARVPDDDDLVKFSMGVVKILLVGSACGLVGYVNFLIVGALLADYVDGSLRLIGTTVATIAIPLIAALGEASKRERFRVVTRTADRVMKTLTTAVVFFIGLGLLSSLIAANEIVRELRTDPNWFMTNPESTKGIPAANRKVSYFVGDFVGGAMGAIGLYDERQLLPKKGGPTRTPPRTRTKEKAPESTEAAPRTKTDHEKSDYVKW